jgi:Domain of unknown function (DUF4394)
MSRIRLLRTGASLATVLALSAVAAQASHKQDDNDRGWSKNGPDRLVYATTSQNQLISFNARNPERIKTITSITGTNGATLRGIDFRPKTGDLYGVGSDNIVYRVNPTTGIAIAEGPAFTPALNGTSYGVDFNPAADAIRVVSDAQQNLRLNPDAGTATQDMNLNPGMPQVVAAGYENSSFSFTQPAATTLHVVDAASDQLFTQTPPNNGTLINPRKLRGVDVGLNAGFDIAGDGNMGFLSNARSGRGTELYTVDVPTGKTKSLGRIGGGKRLVVTGLAAWQD